MMLHEVNEANAGNGDLSNLDCRPRQVEKASYNKSEKTINVKSRSCKEVWGLYLGHRLSIFGR